MKKVLLTPIILKILEENETARRDDFVLYGCVLKELRIPLTLQLKSFLATAYKLNAPIFESVARVRRRLQEAHPELCVETTRINRHLETEKYKKFNRGEMEL